MALANRIFSRGFFVVLALTTLLFLAGIIILPSLGPTYADEVQAQTEPSAAPAVTPNTGVSAAVYQGHLFRFGGGAVLPWPALNNVQICQP